MGEDSTSHGLLSPSLPSPAHSYSFPFIWEHCLLNSNIDISRTREQEVVKLTSVRRETPGVEIVTCQSSFVVGILRRSCIGQCLVPALICVAFLPWTEVWLTGLHVTAVSLTLKGVLGVCEGQHRLCLVSTVSLMWLLLTVLASCQPPVDEHL